MAGHPCWSKQKIMSFELYASSCSIFQRLLLPAIVTRVTKAKNRCKLVHSGLFVRIFPWSWMLSMPIFLQCENLTKSYVFKMQISLRCGCKFILQSSNETISCSREPNCFMKQSYLPFNFSLFINIHQFCFTALFKGFVSVQTETGRCPKDAYHISR